MVFNSQFSILNSVCRFEFFQPIAVLAAARYCGGLRGPRYRRSQLGEVRAAANATTFVVLDLRLRDIHSVHFPFHSCPQHEFLGHNGYFKLVMSLSHHIEACALDNMGLDEKWFLEALRQDGIWLSEGLVPWQSMTWRRRFPPLGSSVVSSV